MIHLKYLIISQSLLQSRFHDLKQRVLLATSGQFQCHMIESQTSSGSTEDKDKPCSASGTSLLRNNTANCTSSVTHLKQKQSKT